MFDPNQCATSSISGWCGDVVTQDIFQRHVRSAQRRSNITPTKMRMPGQPQSKESDGRVCLCFRLAAAVEPKVVRTGKGRVTRKLRDAQETRERLRGKSGIQASGRKERAPQQEPPTDVDTSFCRTGVGTIQATANGRLANASFGLPTLNRIERISGERVPGVDDVSVVRSPLEPDDWSGRQSNEKGTVNGTASARRPHGLDVGTRCDCNKRQPRRRRFSDAVGSLSSVPLVIGATPRRVKPCKETSNQSVWRRASACGTFQPRHNQNRSSCWSNSSLFRLLESRVRKLTEQSQINSRGSVKTMQATMPKR